MNNKIFNYLIFCLGLFLILCYSNDDSLSPNLAQCDQESLLGNAGERGAANDECDFASQGAAFAIRMTGNLEGCVLHHSSTNSNARRAAPTERKEENTSLARTTESLVRSGQVTNSRGSTRVAPKMAPL